MLIAPAIQKQHGVRVSIFREDIAKLNIDTYLFASRIPVARKIKVHRNVLVAVQADGLDKPGNC